MNCSSGSVRSRNWLKDKADQTDNNDVDDGAADAAHNVDDDAADAVHDVDDAAHDYAAHDDSAHDDDDAADAAHDYDDAHRAVTLWVVCITTKCT